MLACWIPPSPAGHGAPARSPVASREAPAGRTMQGGPVLATRASSPSTPARTRCSNSRRTKGRAPAPTGWSTPSSPVHHGLAAKYSGSAAGTCRWRTRPGTRLSGWSSRTRSNHPRGPARLREPDARMAWPPPGTAGLPADQEVGHRDGQQQWPAPRAPPRSRPSGARSPGLRSRACTAPWPRRRPPGQEHDRDHELVVESAAPVTSAAGRNISEMPRAAASLASCASGRPSAHVMGKNR